MEQPQILRRPFRRKQPQRPDSARVVIYNDDVTTFEFVIGMLVEIFFKDVPAARALAEEIDQKGQGVAGIYPVDIAQSKADAATESARQQGFPLRIEAEPL